MTENKRIALNTLATYGRSVFGVLCGVFSTRWVLEALGQVDFGLYGLVGSLAIFVSFLNIQFSSAIARYYAFSIGEAQKNSGKEDSLEECQSWFSVALMIHTVLPVVLVLIGYPIGAYAITHNMLNIPLDRVDVCIWLWRFVCISCFISMVNVPFSAMFTAKQYIAELTIYSFLQTLLRTLFIYYMVCSPRDWLFGYGLGMMLASVFPAVLICARAWYVFPECVLRLSAILQFWRVAKLGMFAFWQGVGGLGFVASHQGMSILINNCFGARITGSFSVSQTVAGESASLTGALQGAFMPAIATAIGSGNVDRMRTLAFESCKIGTLLTLMFAIPMALEIEEVLALWLKQPPPFVPGLCLSTLAFIVIEKLSSGHVTAVNACGRVARFQTYRGLLRTSVILIAALIISMGGGVLMVSLALPISAGLVVVCDVRLACGHAGMSIKRWLVEVLAPLSMVSALSIAISLLPRLFLDQGVARLFITSLTALVTLAVGSWYVVLSSQERLYVQSRLWGRNGRRC